MDQTRVLVVDDEPTMLKLMEGIMSQLNCRASYAQNGKEAVEKVRRYNFDICFMDIMMPEMGGVATTTVIRQELTRLLPIVAVTSGNMNVPKEIFCEVGMVDFIIKPVDVDMIQKAISRYALRSP